jgi:hypothetical protein
MQSDLDPGRVMVTEDLAEFFRDALRGVLANQRIAVADQTVQYVVNMLTLFARAEELHPPTANNPLSSTLVQMLADSLEADTAAQRDVALQRLGDVSLFTAGFFARGFERSLVDVDYHIAMGGRAYLSLARSFDLGRSRTMGHVFAELAAKFQPLVDVLSEISDAAYVYTQRDILRLYEIWLKTGSERARALLRRLGIEAAPVALRAH